MYKHALCLHPYLKDSSAGTAGVAIFPPTGIEFIAASLKPHVGKLTLVDLRLPGPMHRIETLHRFIREEIDLLCISINWEYFFPEVCALVNSLPQNVTTIVGGKQATDYMDPVFERCPGVQAIVRGEGEETIVDIAQGKEWADIPGMSYRRDGEIVHNPKRTLKGMDTYAFPDRSLRYGRYHIFIGGITYPHEEFDVIQSSRGCPFDCKFCTFNRGPWGQIRRYSPRSVDSVMEELHQVKAGLVFFSDEDFFVNPGRAKEISNRIVREGIKKRFAVQTRIDAANHPDMLEAAARAGFKVLLLGIESPNDRILEQLNKGFDSQSVRRAFDTFRRFPFWCHGYFIYGNITETEEEMLRIPVFADELGLDSISYQKLRVENYSPLKELVEATPGYYLANNFFVFSDEMGPERLTGIKHAITRRFYTPSRLWQAFKKLLRLRLFAPATLIMVIISTPIMLTRSVVRKIHKKLRKRFPIWRRWFPGWV